MSNSTERDYVLGTHDDELDRLGIQHRVWRSTVLECWRNAGIGPGSRVLDVGSGPGFASLDLAERVGSTGEVIGLERSNRFVQHAQSTANSHGLTNVKFIEMDLMSDEIPVSEMDAAWCRWVACFVSSPEALVQKIASALKPGGVAVFHEYFDYATWRIVPRSPAQEKFVEHVETSWRASGGEPDIARELPTLLANSGFTLRSMSPRLFCLRPSDEGWQWPASFIDVHLKRLIELGHVEQDWTDSVRREFAEATANPNAMMITPLVLEIIATRD